VSYASTCNEGNFTSLSKVKCYLRFVERVLILESSVCCALFCKLLLGRMCVQTTGIKRDGPEVSLCLAYASYIKPEPCTLKSEAIPASKPLFFAMVPELCHSEALIKKLNI